jgi:predicted transcriptional regulator
MEADLYPYVILLPRDRKRKVLRAIFGSSVPVEIINFAIEQGISEKIYQKDLIEKLGRSNKTVIDYLEKLTDLGILEEDMEKVEKESRKIWLKVYQLSDLGRWFALLLIDEKSLSKEERTEIVLSISKSYVKWMSKLYEKLGLDKHVLEELLVENTK